mgnify:CR=1 FL=1
MGFIKKNSYHITRLVINQVGIIVFSLVINMTVTVMPKNLQESMSIVASAFASVFYLFLVFYAMREAGNRDSVKINDGRMKHDAIFGLKVGLLAAVVNYFFSFLMLIGLIFTGTAFGETLFETALTVTNFILQPMYSGMIYAVLRALPQTLIRAGAVVCYLITPALAAVSACIGYNYGCRHPQVEKKR